MTISFLIITLVDGDGPAFGTGNVTDAVVAVVIDVTAVTDATFEAIVICVCCGGVASVCFNAEASEYGGGGSMGFVDNIVDIVDVVVDNETLADVTDADGTSFFNNA